MKALVDTNVVLDVLLRRSPFYQDSFKIFQLIDLFSVVPVSEITIADALALRWKDFEDAVQYIVARESGVTHIITRNKADYKADDIHCMSPTEFIAYTRT
jgi:predicted nucleic acid-binding protein